MSDTHSIRRLWVRPSEGSPMEPREALEVKAGAGIVGDHSFHHMRHLTLVFEDDWKAAADELGREVDPVGRRANVLVSGGGGRRYVGQRVRLGPVLIEIKGITEPCPVMEKAAEGMQAALQPDGRAGIWGRVLEGGRVTLTDVLSLETATA